MKNKLASLLTGSFMLLESIILSTDANATTRVVPDNQPTISQAVSISKDGDEVIVKPGIYYENIIVNKSITLRSTNPLDRNTVNKTIINRIFLVQLLHLIILFPLLEF